VAQKANLLFKNRFPYISAIDEASDFKFGMHLGFVIVKAHHQIPLEEKWVWPRAGLQQSCMLMQGYCSTHMKPHLYVITLKFRSIMMRTFYELYARCAVIITARLHFLQCRAL